MSSNDFGIKVSLPGWDVENAADTDLYLSSSWPNLKIDLSLSSTVTLGAGSLGSASATITHNLTYPPFTLIWSKANGLLGPASSVNSTTITLTSTPYDTLRYYICRNPLNINFQAPNIVLNSIPGGGKPSDWGIKFTKPGKDYSSTDYRDYTIHSATKSLQVHQVIYSPLSAISGGVFNGEIGLEYITELPYSPIYFGFYSSDNQNFVPLSTASGTFPKIGYDPIPGGVAIINSTTPGGWGVFYILLDPFLTSNTISVTL